MVRASYYQPEGNPVERQLLPKQPMPLEFAYCRQSLEVVLAIRNRVLLTAAIFDVHCFVAFFLFTQFQALTPFLAVATIGWFLAFREPTPKLGYSGGGLLTISLLSHLLLVVFSRTSLPLPVIAVWLSAAIYSVGLHWIYRCTVSPTSRNAAAWLISQWKPQLLLYSSAPIALVVLSVVMKTEAVFWFGLLAMAVVQLGLVISDLRLARAIYKSLTSYLTYNYEDEQTIGTFASPAGGSSRRHIILLTAATLCAAWVNRPSDVQVAWPIPCLVFLALPALLLAPLSVQANLHFGKQLSGDSWREFVRDLRVSVDAKVRNALFAGRVAYDGMPILYPMSAIAEHMHFLGSSGSNKTSKGLLPLIEQLIEKGDRSVVCIDLKGDKLEILGCMQDAIAVSNQKHNRQDELKLLSSDSSRGSHAFNPLTTETWKSLSVDERVSLFATASNLIYGEDYGPAHFDALNTQLVRVLFESYPNAQNFRDLYNGLNQLLKRKSIAEYGSELQKAGTLVRETLRRLSVIDAMQVASQSGIPPEVTAGAIQLERFVTEPSFLYMYLPSNSGAKTAPAVARMFLFQLLEAARRKKEDRIPVVVVIDEFQMMVAPNIASILQQARSMGVGLVLANQSMQDLKSLKTDLIPAVELNCRYRQWFDCSSEDMERLVRMSGDRVETLTHTGFFDVDQTSISRIGVSETILPRLNKNEIKSASNHPMQSIVHIRRGEDYAQYEGVPFVAMGDYHISKAEYKKLSLTEWPDQDPSLIKPGTLPLDTSPAPNADPIFTGLGDDEDLDLDSNIDRLLDESSDTLPSPWEPGGDGDEE